MLDALSIDDHATVITSVIVLWSYQRLVRWQTPYKIAIYNQVEVIVTNLLIWNIVVSQYIFDPEVPLWLIIIGIIGTAGLNTAYFGFAIWKIFAITIFGLIDRIRKKGSADEGEKRLMSSNSNSPENTFVDLVMGTEKSGRVDSKPVEEEEEKEDKEGKVGKEGKKVEDEKKEEIIIMDKKD